MLQQYFLIGAAFVAMVVAAALWMSLAGEIVLDDRALSRRNGAVTLRVLAITGLICVALLCALSAAKAPLSVIALSQAGALVAGIAAIVYLELVGIKPSSFSLHIPGEDDL